MNRFKRILAALMAGCSLGSNAARADNVTVNENFSNTVTTRFPTPLPSNGQTNTFTTFSGSAVPYIMNSFYVNRPGTVTATLSGLSTMNSQVAVGAYFLTGTFSPNAMGSSTTPLSNFIVGQQGFPTTTIFASLQPGVLYSYLLLFSSGTSGVSTLMLSGDGCISIGRPCVAFVPNSTGRTGDVASLLDNLAPSAPTDLSNAINALGMLSDDEQTAALERLVPVPSQSLMVASREAMQSSFDRMNGRLDALRIGDHASIDPLTGLASVASERATRNGLWMNTYGLTSRDSAHDGFAGFASYGYGLTLGADRKLTALTTAGVSLSYSSTDLSFHNQRVGDSSAVKSHQLSFYGSHDFSMGYVDAMVAYSMQRYDSRRNTTVNGIAHGRFDGNQWGARIGAGLPRMLGGGVELTPRFSLEWNKVAQDSFTESRGGPLALNVGSTNARRWRTSLGFEVGRDTVLSDETTVEPYFRLFWNRDLVNDGVRTAASFVGGGTAFSAPGRELDRDSFTTGVGVNMYRSEGFTASLGYDLTLNGQSVSQVPQFTARWAF